MRESVAALALIRRCEEGRPLWLARWNVKWRAYHFVGGHKDDGESFRECLVREVGEELHLQEGTGYAITAAPAAHLEYDAWSERAQAETHYVTEVFELELAGASALQQIDADPANRWLSGAEIRAGRSGAEGRISSTMALLLDRMGLGLE